MRKLGWKRYLIGGLLMLLLQAFSILIQMRGEFFYAYGFNFVLSLGIMMWSAKLFEDKQRTFLRYMRDFLPYLLQTVLVIAVNILIMILVANAPYHMPDQLRTVDVLTVVARAYVTAGLHYIVIQILCAAIGFLIAAGFSLADFIKRRR